MGQHRGIEKSNPREKTFPLIERGLEREGAMILLKTLEKWKQKKRSRTVMQFIESYGNQLHVWNKHSFGCVHQKIQQARIEIN